MKLRGKYKKGKRTFVDSVKNCLDGINYVLANEKNFVREIILGICAILMSYFLQITRIEWIIVLLLINKLSLHQYLMLDLSQTQLVLLQFL